MVGVDYKIILPTNVKYLDITRNFIDLLEINWPEAIQHLIISITGQNTNTVKINNIPIVFNKENSTLPTCIYNAAQKNKADYYLVFLGDAFISKKVNDLEINALLAKLMKNSINYCRLLPQLSFHKNRGIREYRKLNSNERYGHSFVAFGASSNFIEREFGVDITDRQFEIKYLKIANEKKDVYFNDRVILKQNIFHILPSIQKGKWDRINIFYLRRKYPKIKFSDREVISWKYESIIQLRKIVLPIIPNNLRLKLKASNKEYFDTDI
ncbi:hypothetical protein LTY37_07375 [Limosilactobacillus agrestis]|uniref:hypothetical protein n=1 Tax=Limosilactobacillus agrestis TaxID=2759748 RepID=UPI001E4AECB7|nr:hypothetical protein [Limosilactobacillus agrestis]MCD7120627.1 hypothetical protein [Limosilactobacillus agrestis]